MTKQCAVSWCSKPVGHNGKHVRVLANLAGVDPDNGEAAALQLGLETQTGHVPVLILHTDSCRMALSWQQANELIIRIAGARRRYT